MKLKLSAEVMSEIEALAMAGVSDETICDNLGLDWKDWTKTIKENSILAQTVKDGRRMGIEKVSLSLFTEALGGDTSAAKWYLKNKDPDNWNDVSTVKNIDAGKETPETGAAYKQAIDEEKA